MQVEEVLKLGVFVRLNGRRSYEYGLLDVGRHRHRPGTGDNAGTEPADDAHLWQGARGKSGSVEPATSSEQFMLPWGVRERDRQLALRGGRGGVQRERVPMW